MQDFLAAWPQTTFCVLAMGCQHAAARGREAELSGDVASDAEGPGGFSSWDNAWKSLPSPAAAARQQGALLPTARIPAGPQPRAALPPAGAGCSIQT